MNNFMILLKVPNRSEQKTLFCPHVAEGRIWCTDSLEDLYEMLEELNKNHPAEAIYPVIHIQWQPNITIDDLHENCVSAKTTMSSWNEKPGKHKGGDTWYRMLE